MAMAKGTVLFYLINEVSVHSCTNTSFPTNGVPVKNFISAEKRIEVRDFRWMMITMNFHYERISMQNRKDNNKYNDTQILHAKAILFGVQPDQIHDASAKCLLSMHSKSGCNPLVMFTSRS